jgi:uncharacterized membrane protein HdeD (DUF308 family)
MRLLAWLTIARGCLALVLGVILLLQLERTGETLATFMGLYWLTGGILALTFHREIRSIGARRAPIVAGIFGVVAGSAVLIRTHLLPGTPSAQGTFLLIGVLILMNGLTNLASGSLARSGPVRRRSRESDVLGVLEIALGAGIIIRDGEPGPLVFLATTAWALTAGVVLVGQGLRMRQRLAAAASLPSDPGQVPR